MLYNTTSHKCLIKHLKCNYSGLRGILRVKYTTNFKDNEKTNNVYNFNNFILITC